MLATVQLKGKSKMNQKEALDLIIGLRKENVSFEEIAAKLKELDYRSERSKEHVTAQTARWMFNNFDIVDGRMIKRDKPATQKIAAATRRKPSNRLPVVEVSTGPKGDLLELAKMIINNDKMSVSSRVEYLQRLVKDEPAVTQQ